MTAVTLFVLAAAFGAAILARSRASRARPAPIAMRRRGGDSSDGGKR